MNSVAAYAQPISMGQRFGISARALLQDAINSGVVGSYVLLAAATGLAPEHARVTLKELRRCGACTALRRAPTGRAGAAPAVYGRAANDSTIDALAHVRAVWR